MNKNSLQRKLLLSSPYQKNIFLYCYIHLILEQKGSTRKVAVKQKQISVTQKPI